VAESATLHQPETHDQHPHSAVPYVVVWIALLVFTAVTYLTGVQHLGKWALAIALAIACTKSALVALIFMHLRESSGATRLVFVTSLVFVALLLFFTVSDVATRFTLATPAGAPFGTERSQPEGLLEHEMPAEE
jgi:cytochrome c oxidase subunit 4